MERLVEIGLLNALLMCPIALLAAILGRLIRRPAVRHGLWVLVLLKLLTPPLLDWPVALPERTDAITQVPSPPVHDASTIPAGSPEQLADAQSPATTDERQADSSVAVSVEPSPRGELELTPTPCTTIASEDTPAYKLPSWQFVAFGTWITVSLLWFTIAGVRLRNLRRFVGANENAPRDVQQLVGRLAEFMGLRCRPAVWMMPGPVPPMILSLGTRNHLLLPRELWAGLTASQRETLVLHELAHLRRKDHWVRWLEFVVMGTYFWHPVVWWARRQLRDAEEESCDAHVIAAMPGAREAYATTLLETVAFLTRKRSALPMLGSGAGHVRFLQRRLHMIMKGSLRSSRSWIGVLALLAVAMLLPWQPTRAQSDSGARASTPRPVGDPIAPSADPVDQPTPAPRLPALPKSTSAGLAESSKDTQDEVELLRVQLQAKQAEVQEAKVSLNQARRQADRLVNLKGAVSSEETDQARTEVELREARLAVKEANVKEAAMRVAQAERRATSLRQRSVQAPASALNPVADTARAYPVPPVTPPMAEIPPYPSRPSKNAPTAPATPLYPRATEAAPMNLPPAHVDREQRLRDIEAKLDSLSKEIASLKQLLQSQTDKRK